MPDIANPLIYIFLYYYIRMIFYKKKVKLFWYLKINQKD